MTIEILDVCLQRILLNIFGRKSGENKKEVFDLRFLRLFDQRLVATRETGELEFYYRRIWADSQSKTSIYFQIAQSLFWVGTTYSNYFVPDSIFGYCVPNGQSGILPRIFQENMHLIKKEFTRQTAIFR